jgi:hypothetical protein
MAPLDWLVAVGRYGIHCRTGDVGDMAPPDWLVVGSVINFLGEVKKPEFFPY